MPVTTQKPDDNILRDMAIQPKMTFARMARELAVDRKTVRRWCRDAGIEECGSAASVNETSERVNDKAKNVTREPESVTKIPEIDTDKPFAETTLPGDDQPNTDSIMATLERKISWLIERNTLFHDRLRMMENAMVGAACPVPYMADAPLAAMFKIAYKLGAGEKLTEEENSFFADFCMLTRAATAADFTYIDRKIENHWHVNLPLGASRAYMQEKKNDRA